MNYKAAGAPKKGKNAPKHAEHNAHGSGKKPFGQREDKAAPFGADEEGGG